MSDMDQRTADHADATQTRAVGRDRVAELHQVVDEWRRGAQADPERWERWLRAQASVPGFSAESAVLIAVQLPDRRPGDAELAAMRAWNGVGRTVTKGEHGIQALAPVVENVYYAVPEEGDGLWREVEKDGALWPGERLQTRKEVVGEKATALFSRDQTTGGDLPETVTRRELRDASQLTALTSVAVAGATRHRLRHDSPAYAWADEPSSFESTGPEFDKSTVMREVEEFARFETRGLDRRDEPGIYDHDRIAATSVASVVAQAHGVTPSPLTAEYREMRDQWLAGASPEMVASTQQRVQETAERIIAGSDKPHAASGGLREVRQQLREQQAQKRRSRQAREREMVMNRPTTEAMAR